MARGLQPGDWVTFTIRYPGFVIGRVVRRHAEHRTSVYLDYLKDDGTIIRLIGSHHVRELERATPTEEQELAWLLARIAG